TPLRRIGERPWDPPGPGGPGRLRFRRRGVRPRPARARPGRLGRRPGAVPRLGPDPDAAVPLGGGSAQAQPGPEAQARFLQVAEESPNDPWADRALVHAARVALDARKFDDARSLAGRLAARYPTSPLRPDARLIEARALQATGGDEAAIPLF